jgi:hypothetical protein
MIPKSVEEVLDPYFRIDECPDTNEMNAWMSWLSSAVYRANVELAHAKLNNEDAIEDHKAIYNREILTGGAEGGITEKKIAAEVKQEVIDAYKKVIDTKFKVRIAEGLLESIKEKVNCIKKIATLESNTIQYGNGNSKSSNNKDGCTCNHQEVQHQNQFPQPKLNIFGNFNPPPTGFFM